MQQVTIHRQPGATIGVTRRRLTDPAVAQGARVTITRRSSLGESDSEFFRLFCAEEHSVRILGSRVHLLSVSRTVDQIEEWIQKPDGSCHQVVVTGFHGLWEAHKTPRLHAILNGADLWVPDGIAPVAIARLRGHREAVRAPGAEIMRELFSRCRARKYRSYFYGDTEATLSALRTAVMRDYPHHEIAGMFSPPFRRLTREEDHAAVAAINQTQPDVLWISLGMPKQDIWIHERLHQLQVPVAIGVGAAFAFVAGTVDRCPEWMGNAGFEWAYRLFREPRKLWRRDLLDGPRFLFCVGREFLQGEKSIVSQSKIPE